MIKVARNTNCGGVVDTSAYSLAADKNLAAVSKCGGVQL